MEEIRLVMAIHEWSDDQSAIGWEKTGPNPTDGGKSGSKSSVLTEGDGIPLAVAIDGANDQDMKLTEPTLKAIAIERADVTDQNPPNMCLGKGYD